MFSLVLVNINLLITKEYWPEVMAVWTEHSKVCTKNDRGPLFPSTARARLVSSILWHGVMFVLNLPAFKNKKYTAYDSFHGNGPHGKNPDQERTTRMLRFPSRLPCHLYNNLV